MTKSELLERLNSLKDDLDVLCDHADELENESSGVNPYERSSFLLSFANVKKALQADCGFMFDVGDVIINEHEKFGLIPWAIIGKNVDRPKEDPDRPTLTLQMLDVLPGVYEYDTESDAFPYGHAHYPSSTIRNTLNTEILNGFSDADRAAMLEVEKITYTVNDEGGRPETTADKLFLLSSSEVGFKGDFVRPEGDVYEYFADLPANRRKHELNDAAAARSWWLRSPYPGHANNARIVSTSGAQNYNCAYYGTGAAAACVIG